MRNRRLSVLSITVSYLYQGTRRSRREGAKNPDELSTDIATSTNMSSQSPQWSCLPHRAPRPLLPRTRERAPCLECDITSWSCRGHGFTYLLYLTRERMLLREPGAHAVALVRRARLECFTNPPCNRGTGYLSRSGPWTRHSMVSTNRQGRGGQDRLPEGEGMRRTRLLREYERIMVLF